MSFNFFRWMLLTHIACFLLSFRFYNLLQEIKSVGALSLVILGAIEGANCIINAMYKLNSMFALLVLHHLPDTYHKDEPLLLIETYQYALDIINAFTPEFGTVDLVLHCGHST